MVTISNHEAVTALVSTVLISCGRMSMIFARLPIPPPIFKVSSEKWVNMGIYQCFRVLTALLHLPLCDRPSVCHIPVLRSQKDQNTGLHNGMYNLLREL